MSVFPFQVPSLWLMIEHAPTPQKMHAVLLCLVSLFWYLAVITVTSQWMQWCLKSPASWLFAQTFVQAQFKENISSTSLAFVRGIRRWPGKSSHKGSVTRKMFPFDDVILVTCGLKIFFHPYTSGLLHWESSNRGVALFQCHWKIQVTPFNTKSFQIRLDKINFV